jgi:Domain of unknown function (DUF397)
MTTEETPIDMALWRKSRRSIGNGACVEIAPASGAVAVRDSTDRVGPVLRYCAPAWHSFIADAKIGNFDVVR